MPVKLFHGDCLHIMPTLPAGSVDMVLTDLPYGTTVCAWDAVIPFEPLWQEFRRICKPNAAIVLTAIQPFTSALVMSNPAGFAHAWVWDKGVASNFVQAERMPLKTHEDILVFSPSGKQPRYFPLMAKRYKPMKMGGNSGKRGTGAYDLRGPKIEAREGDGKIYTDAFPDSIVFFSMRSDRGRGMHPTQKPVALMEYLIRTYTEEGDTVMDCTMGSGTTGVACRKTGRSFIGIEKDAAYFDLAKKRIDGDIIDDDADADAGEFQLSIL